MHTHWLQNKKNISKQMFARKRSTIRQQKNQRRTHSPEHFKILQRGIPWNHEASSRQIVRNPENVSENRRGGGNFSRATKTPWAVHRSGAIKLNQSPQARFFFFWWILVDNAVFHPQISFFWWFEPSKTEDFKILQRGIPWNHEASSRQIVRNPRNVRK